jgi:hypothetical protein
LFFRRAEDAHRDGLGYERLIINRKDKTITSEFLAETSAGEAVAVEKGVLAPEGDNTQFN